MAYSSYKKKGHISSLVKTKDSLRHSLKAARQNKENRKLQKPFWMSSNPDVIMIELWTISFEKG